MSLIQNQPKFVQTLGNDHGREIDGGDRFAAGGVSEGGSVDPGLSASLVICAGILGFTAVYLLMARILKLPAFRYPNTWRDFFWMIALNRYESGIPYSAYQRKGAVWLALAAGAVAAALSMILVAKLTY